MSASEWQFARQPAAGRQHMVAAKTRWAAEAGLDVLRRGGNAVDAAVVTGFVSGVVEPMMSGIGGGGFMVIHLAGDGDRPARQVVIDHAMRAPEAARDDMFELVGGVDTALFGWPNVRGAENILGYRSMAVPGTVAGLCLALERFGTISLEEALAPAIAYAEDGFPMDWFQALHYLIHQDLLSRYPETAAVFLPLGRAPAPPTQGVPIERIAQPDLAQTLRRIASDGPDAFYRGPIAAQLVGEIQAHGGLLNQEDLASYQATVIEGGLRGRHRGHELVTSPTHSAGPTLIETFNILDGFDLARLGHNSPEALHLAAEATRLAFADRLTYLADPERAEVPIGALLDPGYAAQRRRLIDPERALATPAPGLVGLPPSPRPEGRGGRAGAAASGDSTTHLCTADRWGNMVSLTQTLLYLFGSHVVVPGTGVLMNDGLMWFDPRPGARNSIGGGKRPLSNMGPLLLLRDGQPRAVIGASGGRRILSAVAQIALNLIDYELAMQPAIAAPRFDASTADLLLPQDMPADAVDGLRRRGHPVVLVEDTFVDRNFASPVGIARTADGDLAGGADVYYNALAVGE